MLSFEDSVSVLCQLLSNTAHVSRRCRLWGNMHFVFVSLHRSHIIWIDCVSQSLNVNLRVRTANTLSSRLEKLSMRGGELTYCLKKIFDHVIAVASLAVCFHDQLSYILWFVICCVEEATNRLQVRRCQPAVFIKWDEKRYLSHLLRGHLWNACTPSSPSHNRIRRHGLGFERASVTVPEPLF